MNKLIFIAVLCLLTFGGCDDSLTTGDSIAKDANSVSTGAQAVLDSPAGLLIPPNVKYYILLGIGLINGAVFTWQEWRNRTMKKTTRAIVRGIEETDNPEKAVSELKANIAEAMRRQGGDKFYAKANKIVERLKIS